MSAEAALAGRSAIYFRLPIRTVSEANARTHWSTRARRAREERQTAWAWAAGSLVGFGAKPARDAKLDAIKGWLITLTRVAPRALDSDNLAISAKHVRDGIADALGIDDGDERLEWRYAQRKPIKGEPKYCVHVTMEPRW